jgi:hypothetical protein
MLLQSHHPKLSWICTTAHFRFLGDG